MNPGTESIPASHALPGVPRRSALRRAGDAVRSLLGLHRRFVVEGVQYTERSAEPLRRALSRRGSGRKDYDVLFPDGQSMRIRATPAREYADLVGARLRPVLALIEPLVRPGMRVMDAGAGTGHGASWLADRVGPSGAVVAIERDRESVRYAAARYRSPNIAFEAGWLDALRGETDGSFDGVMCCDAIRAGDDAERALRELWRLVGPGGWLLLAAPTVTDESLGAEGPRAFTHESLEMLVRESIGAEESGGARPPANGAGRPEVEPGPADAGGRLALVVRRPER